MWDVLYNIYESYLISLTSFFLFFFIFFSQKHTIDHSNQNENNFYLLYEGVALDKMEEDDVDLMIVMEIDLVLSQHLCWFLSLDIHK